MKLYTEEQVIDIFEKYGNMSAINARNIIDLSESIELPSDEEVEQIADACHPFAEQIGGDIYVAYRAFKQGLQLMRDKIQGGNNEY